MASYIAIFLCLVCLILLIILLFRFKKLFSTDSIIEKTRNQMNKMISDINNNANRDMELINDCSKRVRALLNESEKKMEQYRQATERLREMIAIAEKMDEEKGYSRVVVENQKVLDIKPVGQRKQDIISQRYQENVKVDPDASYQINQQQGSLFDDIEDNKKSKSILKDETNVTPDGAAYKEVPLIITKIFDEKPVINKTEKMGKQLNENIRKLYNEGLEIEEIAKKLSCSITEVQFIIDML